MLSLSSHLPYPLKEAENGYWFETDSGVRYQLSFTDDSAYLAESPFYGPVFSFSIVCLSDPLPGRDLRIESTVVNVLLLTFAAQPTAVIHYVCSLDDEQELIRSRLFQIWYRRTKLNAFTKWDYTDEHNRVHASVILRKDHPDGDQVRQLFDNVFAK